MCLVGVVVESFVLKLKFNVSGMDFIYLLLPYTFFLMKALLSLDLKERKIYVYFRKMSLLMFVSQRLFLTALPSVLKTPFNLIYANRYVGLFAVLALTIGFSTVVYLCSKKFKFLKWIM